MDVLGRLNEFKALTEKTRVELINLVGSLNKKIEEQNVVYSALVKLKNENDNKYNEELSASKSLIQDQIGRIVELEKQNGKLITDSQINLGAAYDIKWNWVDKIVFVLKSASKPLRSSEIVEILCKVDNLLNSKSDPQKSLSVHLSKAVKYGRIIGAKQKGKVGYLYSLAGNTGILIS
jgi:hypothetical protein